MSTYPRIASVGTAVPAFRISQADVLEVCRKRLAALPGQGRLLEILGHAGVEYRHFCFPPDYYLERHDFSQRNQDFLSQALSLSAQAIESALKGEPAGTVDHIISVTTTGILTPSLEAHLFTRLPFRKDVRRTPLFGLGCAAGVNGIGLARDYALAYPRSRTLLLAVELCGQAFQAHDTTPRSMVATALFGDGVAAVLVDGAERGDEGPEILGSRSELIPRSLDVMGWDVTSNGLELVLSKSVDWYVRHSLPPAAAAFLEASGVEASKISHWILHPGGPKILDAYQEALQLPPGALRVSRNVLRCFGNTSSASVLFVLRDVLTHSCPQRGEYGLMAAMGPGFAAELAMLRF
jgi:alkylresorcinol/alkylpyrone synthase